jgi:YbbR domain-containing protein
MTILIGFLFAFFLFIYIEKRSIKSMYVKS